MNAHPWTLYGSSGSGSAAVEMALVLCGQRYTVVRASTWEPDSDRAALAAVNPLGQIPTLVDAGGAVLTESAAILVELGLRFPARARLHACWSLFAQAFEPHGPYLSGAELGAADLLASVVSRWSGGRAHLSAAHPARAAWLQRVDTHPVVAEAVTRHWPTAA